MKKYIIIGNLESDISSENYPEADVCDSCAEKNERVMMPSGRSSAPVDKCHFCRKTFEEDQK